THRCSAVPSSSVGRAMLCHSRGPVRSCLALIIIVASWSTSRGADEEDFYRGKRMTMVIGSTAGDGTDLYARLIARHMSRHIPGRPQILAINTPGANGLLAANRLFNLDSKDGLSIGTFSRYAVYEPLWNNPSARFVPERFNWIGNVSVDVSVCVTWHA